MKYFNMKISSIFLIFAIIIPCISCTQTSSRGKLKLGEKCYLTQECLGAISEIKFDELNKVSNRNDAIRLEEMILQGSIYILNTSDQCTLLELKFGKCKIRIDKGTGPIAVWVSKEFISSKENYSSSESQEKEILNDNPEKSISQTELKKGMLDFKEVDSIIGTIWECRSNDIRETFVLHFISKSEATLTSKSLGTLNQTYTIDYPCITFIPEGARESKGYISNSILTIDYNYKFICVKK